MSGFRFAPSLESLDERLNLSPVVPLAGDDAPASAEVRHTGGANFVFADGSVRFLKSTTAPSADTSAIVFVGGWGSSSYQY